jgi:DNA primase
LFRHAPEVIFCFDGDRAGREAAWRALENALPVLHEGRQVSFLFLPEGEDPDTLVRKEGKEAFEARLGGALSLPDYFFQALAGQVDLARRDAPARIAELAKPLLSNLRSEALKHLMLEHIAVKNRLAGASLARILPAGRARPAAARVSGSQPPGGISPVRRAIQLLLQYPAFAGLAVAEETDFLARLDKPGAELLHNLIDLIRHYPGLSLGAILEHFRGSPHEQHLARLGSEAIPGQPEEHERLFADTLRKLRHEAAALEIERLVNKDRFVGLSEAEKTELKRLLAEKSAVPPV